MSNKILVTGATGTIGKEVVKQLSKHEVSIRVGLRNLDKAKAFKDLNVEIVAFDYEKPDTFTNVLQGIDQLFLVQVYSVYPLKIKQFVDVAKSVGVQHIVYLSVLGADTLESKLIASGWNRKIEKHIETSGISYTFVRPTTFMQNFINYYPPRDGKIYLPLGNGEVGYIDGRDVAAVAVKALTTNGQTNDVYEITGPETLSVYQITNILAKVLGQDIVYIDIPEAEMRQALVNSDYPDYMVDMMMEMYVVYKSGEAAVTTSMVEEATGRKATTFEQFATDYADTFAQIIAA